MGSEAHPTTPELVKSLAEAFDLFRKLADMCRSLQVHLRCPSRCYVRGFGLCKIDPADEKLVDLRTDGLNDLANLLFFTFWQVSRVLKTGNLHSQLAKRYTSAVRFGRVVSTSYASLAKDVALEQVMVLEECWHQGSAFYTSPAHPQYQLERDTGLEPVTVLEKCWDERARSWPLAAANPQFRFRVDEFAKLRERFEALSSQSFCGSPAEQLEAIDTAYRELIVGLRQEEAWATAAGDSRPGAGPAADSTSLECLVTLQQAAAMVHRSKRTLEKYKDKMPAPRVQGGGGKPDEWLWSELRPWLQEEFGRQLPERFPANLLPEAGRN
jgi:hypothetical protein